MDSQIVNANLELMLSEEAGGMLHHLHVNNDPADLVSFYCNPENGAIRTFGTDALVPPLERSFLIEGFMFAVQIPTASCGCAYAIPFARWKGHISTNAYTVIGASIRNYNNKHSFKKRKNPYNIFTLYLPPEA